MKTSGRLNYTCVGLKKSFKNKRGKKPQTCGMTKIKLLLKLTSRKKTKVYIKNYVSQ